MLEEVGTLKYGGQIREGKVLHCEETGSCCDRWSGWPPKESPAVYWWIHYTLIVHLLFCFVFNVCLVFVISAGPSWRQRNMFGPQLRVVLSPRVWIFHGQSSQALPSTNHATVFMNIEKCNYQAEWIFLWPISTFSPYRITSLGNQGEIKSCGDPAFRAKGIHSMILMADGIQLQQAQPLSTLASTQLPWGRYPILSIGVPLL